MIKDVNDVNDGAQLGQEGAGRLVPWVITKLNEYIRFNDIAAGDSLPSESALATRFGVSRVVMREAFRAMAAMGFIEVGNGRKARVTEIKSDVFKAIIEHAVYLEQMSIQQIYDLRRTLESRTVVLAALRRSDREAEIIESHANAMRANFQSADTVMEHDILFHTEVTAAARNPAFVLVLGSFENVLRQSWPVSWRSRMTVDQRMESIECHEKIAGAIKAMDTIAAQDAMAKHFDESVKALISAGVV